MNALIVSLNFTPGHFSHLTANYRMFGECGYDPCLYVHPQFNTMDEKNDYRKVNAPVELKALGKIGAAVFWFPSLKNVVEMFRLRFLHDARLIYVFHEPFDSVANYHRSGFGPIKIAKIMLINLVNVPLLWMAHEVILPSSTSCALYTKRYRWLNASFQRIPLLFDDELSVDDLAVGAKDCISYIGTVAADHAFDHFVEFVAYAVQQDLLPGKSFLIATRSEIPPREHEILQGLAGSGRVIVQSGRPMSTNEINAHYQRSAVVWNAYHRSNQSGVLPKAFMFGAAVISSARTLNEFVDDHVTGIVIRDNSDMAEIAAAISDICANGPRYAEACRSKFLSTFYYRSKMKEFIDLLGHSKPRALEKS